MKLQREINREKLATDTQVAMTEKKEAVRNRKDTRDLLREEHKSEFERNLQAFHSINHTEKKILEGIKQRQEAKEMQHKQGLRRSVV